MQLSTSNSSSLFSLSVGSLSSGKHLETSGISDCVENPDHMCAPHTHTHRHAHTHTHTHTHTQLISCVLSRFVSSWCSSSVQEYVFLTSVKKNVESLLLTRRSNFSFCRRVMWSDSHVENRSAAASVSLRLIWIIWTHLLCNSVFLHYPETKKCSSNTPAGEKRCSLCVSCITFLQRRRREAQLCVAWLASCDRDGCWKKTTNNISQKPPTLNIPAGRKESLSELNQIWGQITFCRSSETEQVTSSVLQLLLTPQRSQRKRKVEKRSQSVSFISPRQLWDLCETKVRLWLISPVSQLFLLRNRCRKSQPGLPVSFKGDLIKLLMKIQNVSSVLERSKDWAIKSQVSPVAPEEF